MALKFITSEFTNIAFDEKLKLSGGFYILYPKIRDDYINFISQAKEKVKFSNACRIEKNTRIQEGQLLFYKTFFNDFRIFIVNKTNLSDLKNKKYDLYQIKILDKRITEKYLLNYFNQNQIKNYISLFLINAFSSFKHLSISILNKLYIPIDLIKIKHGVSSLEITNIQAHDDILNMLIEEYKEVKNNSKLERSKLVLMGAIAENILLKELISNNVKIGHLNKYQGLSSLILLSEIEGINKDDKGNIVMDLSLFKKVNMARNLLHPKRYLEKIKDKDNIIHKGEVAFNKILEDFNLEI